MNLSCLNPLPSPQVALMNLFATERESKTRDEKHLRLSCVCMCMHSTERGQIFFNTLLYVSVTPFIILLLNIRSHLPSPTSPLTCTLCTVPEHIRFATTSSLRNDGSHLLDLSQLQLVKCTNAGSSLESLEIVQDSYRR